MNKILEPSEVFSFTPPQVPEYPKEPSINYENYKSQMTSLLAHFYEDIVTVREKIELLDTIAHKQLKEFSTAEQLPEDLSRTISRKIDQLSDGAETGLIHEKEHLFRRETLEEEAQIPNDLNFIYIQNYIRNRLSPLLKPLTENFFKSPSGPHDSRVTSIIMKLLKLDEFFEDINESNLLSKLNFHYIELLSFMFSSDSRHDLVRKIPSMITIDLRNLIENVTEGGGRDWFSSNISTRNTLLSKESLIDHLVRMCRSEPKKLIPNMDVLFRLKLMRDKSHLKNELRHHIDKAFQSFKSSEDKQAYLKDIHQAGELIKELMFKLKLSLKHLCTVRTANDAALDIMKNQEETALISAITGPNSEAIQPIVGAILRKPITENSFADGGVSRVFQEVHRGLFTPEVIARSKPTVANLTKFQDFERLTMCITRLYEQMDDVLYTLTNTHKKMEKDIMISLTKKILGTAASSLAEKHYYGTDLFKEIDSIIDSLETVVAEQEAIRRELDEEKLNADKAVKDADFQRKLLDRKSIDCGVVRLSELTRIGISRFIPKYRDEIACFDATNFEDNMRDWIKRGFSYDGTCQDKFVFYYLNDKKKYKSIDFFKVVFLEFNSNMELQCTNICHFENKPTEDEKYAVFNEDYQIEKHPNSSFKFDEYFSNNIEVSFEDEINLYNIQSKTVLAIYQLIFKQFHLNNISTIHYRDESKNKSEVIITVEQLYDFLGFLRADRVSMVHNQESVMTNTGYLPNSFVRTTPGGNALHVSYVLCYPDIMEKSLQTSTTYIRVC